MSRKHYIEVAAIVAATAELDKGIALRLARQFAELFAADNPRFDRIRFMAACGVES